MATNQSRRSFFKKSAVAGTAGAAILSNFGRELEAAVERTPKSSMPSDLQITDVRCGYIRGGNHLYVKIHTNQDIWGCGEACDATRGTYHLVKMMGRGLKGQSPLNIHKIHEDLRNSGFFAGSQGGMYVAVYTAIESALWDLVGKALGLPVYQLLGGKFRDRIRVYSDCGSRDATPESLAESAKWAQDFGFTAIKFDMHPGDSVRRGRQPKMKNFVYDRYNRSGNYEDVERWVDSMAAIREAIGPYTDVCIDMHGRADFVTGMRAAKALEPFHLLWLEEPIQAENAEVYRRLTESTSTPICAGENHYLTWGFRELFEKGAVDVIMPDLQKAGGLGEAQRIANYANVYYIQFAPHMVSSYLGAMASAHVCASVPNFLCLEWQRYFHEQPMYKEIVDFDGPMLVDGYIPLSEKPGVGVEINEDAMRKYAVKDVPFFE